MSEILTNTSLSVSGKISARKILVVTSCCTKDKFLLSNLPHGHQVLADQLWDEENDNRAERNFGVLENYRIPAGQLYRGLQHIELMHGIKLLRQTFGTDSIDVIIISAGFGVVHEDQLLPPYEATFADQPTSKILTIARRLQIRQKMNELMSS